MLGLAQKQKGYTPIGLDLRDTYVHAIQFHLEKGEPKLHAAARQPVADAEAVPVGVAPQVYALTTLLEAHPFVGRRVVSALPSGDVDIRPITLPDGVTPGKGPQFREALRMEARSCLLYGPENAILSYLPIDEPGQESNQDAASVLLVAAKKEIVNRHLALLKAVGLQCAHLDIHPCAALRVLNRREAAEPGDAAFVTIELDREHATISLAAGLHLRFSRVVKLGLQTFVAQLMQALEIDAHEATQILSVYGIDPTGAAGLDLDGAATTGTLRAEALPLTVFEICSRALEQFAAEVRRTMHYFSLQRRGAAFTKAYTYGACLPARFEDFLTDALAIPVIRGDAFSPFSRDSGGTSANGAAFVVAAGLALRDDAS